ncbi:hypothetical protein HDV03_001215 [Kappamyces sp. JEL0829]|nr:hypothetical protein HDV03_001215 [Kappamyces sp. JEL0829]
MATILLGGILSAGPAILLQINNISVYNDMFKSLGKQIQLLLTTLDEKYGEPKPIPPNAMETMKALYELMNEIKCFILQVKSYNKIMQFLRSDWILKRIQVFEYSLYGLCLNFQIAAQDIGTNRLQEQAKQDHLMLKRFILEAFSKHQNLDQVAYNSLQVRNDQLVATLNELAQAQIRQKDFGSPELKQNFINLHDNLAIKSSRKLISVSDGMDIIGEDELVYLSDVPLGEGSFGRVQLARWGNQKVAVKQAVDNVLDYNVIAMLHREAKLWFSLRHPNVILLFGAGLNVDRPYLVMQYMANGNVADYLRRNPQTSLYDRVKILTDTSFGMAYLHKKGVIHGDLKPDNILLDEQLVSYISDFGLSKLKDKTNSKRVLSGAARYVAPERYFKGFVINESSDCFAFAMTAYHVLIGETPWCHDSDDVVKEKVKNNIRPMKPNFVPDALWSIISDCWSSQPSNRPPFTSISQSLQLVLSTLPRGFDSDFFAVHSKSVSSKEKTATAMGADFGDLTHRADRLSIHSDTPHHVPRANTYPKRSVPEQGSGLGEPGLERAGSYSSVQGRSSVSYVGNATTILNASTEPSGSRTPGQWSERRISNTEKGKDPMHSFSLQNGQPHANSDHGTPHSHTGGVSPTTTFGYIQHPHSPKTLGGQAPAPQLSYNPTIPPAERFIYAQSLFQSGQPQDAIRIWTALCNEKHQPSMLALADVYLQGRGVPLNLQLVQRYLLMADQLGNPQASYQLGRLYEKGLGREPFAVPDYGAAVKYLQKAVDFGHSSACDALGTLYMTGFNGKVPPDYSAALGWFIRSVRPESKYNAAMISYQKGLFDQSETLFLEAAQMGMKEAHLGLANLYRRVATKANASKASYHESLAHS